MKKLFFVFILTFGQLSCLPSSHAAIVLSVESDASFQQGSGIREVNILAKSTNPIADSLLALSIDLKVENAVFSFVSQSEFIADNYDPDPLSPTYRQWFTSGPRYTRLFNESNYIGFGNLNKEGGSSLQFRNKLEGGMPVPDPTTAALNLDFESPQIFPEIDTPLGKLRVDITGLAPGQYPIDFTFVFADGTSMAEIPASTFNGFFAIAAIPEPTSFALVLAVSSIGLTLRRRHQPGPR